MPNHLANETSPYLLQHKDNPVDWYPWGPEALERAKTEDKPILLSIGYSACHWCHVMEHESFEDQVTADVMNALYVSIKVDREERPDLDSIYMQAVQAMTGSGGWPLTVFLTPEGKPFYGGTYFPNEERHGMPAFQEVLKGVADAYYNRKEDVHQAVTQVGERLKVEAPRKGEMLTFALLDGAMSKLVAQYDWTHGGFGGAPKFPQPMVLEFLLRSFYKQPDHRVLQMLDQTLTRMARGGIYDHLGGGFHRYSTDADWLVPHFEKMLYDNAQLARVYLHAYQLTGKALAKRIAEETLDYVVREMTSPEGGFYATQDADSEGHEGKFYVWRPEEITAALGEDARLFNAYFDVTEEGNFEGKNILNVPAEAPEVALAEGVTPEELLVVALRGKARLLDVRNRRIAPARDEKILTAWNGMMLRTMAEAAAVLERPDYRAVAIKNAEFLLAKLRPNGRLLRSYKDGQAKLLGYLEDYALLIDGLLAVYEATFERRWLLEAKMLAEQMVELFWVEKEGVFYDTGKDHEELIVRPRDSFDNATPSGGAVAADVLLRLALFVGDYRQTRRATRSIRAIAQAASNHPNGFAQWLCALDFYLARPFEVAIIGPLEHPATQALLKVVWSAYLPNKVVAGGNPKQGNGSHESIPLLVERAMVGGRPAAYVCENYACKAPVTSPKELADQLGGPLPTGPKKS